MKQKGECDETEGSGNEDGVPDREHKPEYRPERDLHDLASVKGYGGNPPAKLHPLSDRERMDLIQEIQTNYHLLGKPQTIREVT